MSPTANFKAFAAKSSSKKVVLVEQDLYDPTTNTTHAAGDLTPLGVWSSHQYGTRPSESPASQPYAARVMKSMRIKRSLVAGNRMRGRSIPTVGVVELANTDGGLSGLSDYSAEGQALSVRIGEAGMDYADFEPFFDGLTVSLKSSTDGRKWTIVPAGLEKKFDRPLMKDHRYYGLGPAIFFDSASSEKVVVTHGSYQNPTTSVCVEAYIRTNAIGAVQGVVSKGALNASASWNMWLDASGDLRFLIREDSTTTAYQVTSTSPLVADTWYRVTGQWDGTDIRVYVEGILDCTPTAFSGTPQAGVVDLTLAATSAVNYFDGEISGVRVWIDTVRTPTEIYANAFRELDEDDTTGLALYLKCNEAFGTSTYDDLNDLEGTFTNTPDWATTFTGGEELAGKPRPSSFGEVPNREMVQVDPVGLWFDGHFRSCEAFYAVREGGGKLIPLKTDTASDIDFRTSPRNRIYTAGAVNFRAYAPGQTITISGSASNNGDLVVSFVDEVRGRWIQTTTAPTIEAAGASVTVATKSATHEYTPSEATGRVQLENVPTYPITCTMRGDNVGGYVTTLADIMQRIAEDLIGIDGGDIGSGFAAMASAYPGRACYATHLSDEGADMIMDRLATSFGGNWGFEVGTNDLQLGVVGEPDAGIADAKRLYVDDTNAFSIERLSKVMPVKKTIVEYNPNFRQLTWDELVGAVQSDATGRGQRLRDFLLGTHSEVENDPELSATGSPTADEEYPIGDELDRIKSYGIRRRRALSICNEQFDLHRKTGREIFRVKIGLIGHNVDFRDSTVFITDDRWDSTADEKPCQMISFDASERDCVLECYG